MALCTHKTIRTARDRDYLLSNLAPPAAYDDISGSGSLMEDRSILILYGTETGNAKDAAEKLGRVARRHHFVARVIAMDVFPMVR
jgi:sulfite reductase alpha subunit-like flavoprotein